MKFPLVFCKTCKNCKYRNSEWKNLFNTEDFIRCADINGVHAKIIIPKILWIIDWCKLKGDDDE